MKSQINEPHKQERTATECDYHHNAAFQGTTQ